MGLDSIFGSPYTIAGFIVGVMATMAILRTLRGRRAPRHVEAANSHFESHLARDAQQRDRWRDIRLDRLHEINRHEVERLLAKVEATSPQALNEREREFLDYMGRLAGNTA